MLIIPNTWEEGRENLDNRVGPFKGRVTRNTHRNLLGTIGKDIYQKEGFLLKSDMVNSTFLNHLADTGGWPSYCVPGCSLFYSGMCLILLS